jgi:hypothetical protein
MHYASVCSAGSKTVTLVPQAFIFPGSLDPGSASVIFLFEFLIQQRYPLLGNVCGNR